MSGEYSILEQAQASGGDPRVYITNKVNEYPLVAASAAALGVVLAIIMIYKWWKIRYGKTESLTTPTGMSWAQERSDYGREGAESGAPAAASQQPAPHRQVATNGMGEWAPSSDNCAAANAADVGDDSWMWMDKYVHTADTAAVAGEGMSARPSSDSQFSRALAGL